jgi:hypothetical protein
MYYKTPDHSTTRSISNRSPTKHWNIQSLPTKNREDKNKEHTEWRNIKYNSRPRRRRGGSRREGKLEQHKRRTTSLRKITTTTKNIKKQKRRRRGGAVGLACQNIINNNNLRKEKLHKHMMWRRERTQA